MKAFLLDLNFRSFIISKKYILYSEKPFFIDILIIYYAFKVQYDFWFNALNIKQRIFTSFSYNIS